MTSILENWISKVTGLRISLAPGEAGRNLHDGTLFYEILASYNVIDIERCPPFSPAANEQVARANLLSLSIWFQLVGLTRHWTDDGGAALIAVADKDDGVGLRLLFELYSRLENSGGTFLVSEQNVQMGRCEAGAGGRFRVTRASEPKWRNQPPLPNYFELEEPLRAKGDTVHRYRDYQNKVLGNSKDAMRIRRKKLMSHFPEKEPIVPSDPIKQPPKPLTCKIDDFEKLLTVIPGKEQDFRVNPDEYVKYLKTRRSSSKKNAAYETKMKKKLLHDLNCNMELKGEEEFKKLLHKILLQECQYEKSFKKNLLKLHSTYRHFIDFEERVNKLSIETNVKLVDEKKLPRLVARRRQERRIRELYSKLWEDHQRAIKYETVQIAWSTADELVNLAIKFSDYKEAFRTLPDPKLYREWKEVFFKNFPVLHEPRSFTETQEFQQETEIEDLPDIDKNTQTVTSEIKCIDDEECGLDVAIIDCVNRFNMKTYLNQENEWKLTPTPGEEKFRLIGNVVHRLLDHKYPLPSIAPRDSIPNFKLKILLGSFQDNCAQQVFARLSDYLAKSKVELFDVSMAINYCLNAYLKEKGLSSLGCMIKYNYVENEIKRRNDLKNQTRNRYQRRLVREPETVFRALKIMADDDDEILVGGKEGRHKATQVPSAMDLQSQLTSAGRLGKMAFEILSTGGKLNDVLICCMIVEFLKSLVNRTGFVIVNYPKSMFQAYLLEFIMNGVPFKLPQTTAIEDELRTTEELRVVADFNAIKEKCLEDKITFFVDPAKRKKKLKTEVAKNEPATVKEDKSTARKSEGRKSMKRKSVARKSVSRKSVSRKSVSRKSVARKSVARKSLKRKSVARKSVAKGSRKSLARKSVARGSRKSIAKGSKGDRPKKSEQTEMVAEEAEEEDESVLEPTHFTKSTQTQLLRRTIDFDQLLQMRQSEIVPKIKCSTPQFTSRPFFDKYVKFIKASCTVQEYDFIEPLMIIPAHAVYEKLELVENFDYARFDTTTEKRLARVILNEPWEENDLERKTSYFLFGKDLMDQTVNYGDTLLSSSASSDSSKESLTKRVRQKKEVVVKYRKYDPVKPIKKIKKEEPETTKVIESRGEDQVKEKKKSLSRRSGSRKSVAKGSRKSLARKSVAKGSRKSLARKSVAKGSRKSLARKSVAKGGSRKSLSRKSVARGSRKSLARKSVAKGGSRKSVAKGPRKSTMQRGSFYKETKSKGGARPTLPPERPKFHPNDAGWTLLCEPLEENAANNAANMWESMEYVYLTNMEKIFYLLREHDKKVLPHLTELNQELQTNLCKDNVVKQHLVTNLQLALNSIEQDFRRDPELKSEFHYRVDDIKRTLSKLTYDNLQQLNAHRLDVISKNWTSDHLYAMSDLYMALVQMELDRFVDSLQVLADYYFSMAHAIPESKQFDRIVLKRLHELGLEDEIKRIFEGVKELLSGAFAENAETAEDGESEEIVRSDLINPAHGFVTTPIAAVISSLDRVSNECKSLTTHKDVEKGLQGKVRKITVQQPDSQGNTYEYEVLDDVKSEWSTAVDNELARIKFRLNLIQDRAKSHMDQIVKQFKQVFDGFQEASERRAVKEWAAEADMCYVFQRAIEEETGIQPLMVIDGDRFYIDREILLYPDPPPLPPKALEEIVTDYSFTITQLYSLVAKFKLMAPSGVLDVPLVQVIEEMVMTGVESGRQCLPRGWSQLNGVDLRNIFTSAFGDQTWIDWRDFVIYCSRIQYPTIEELLDAQSKYRETDRNRTELISFNDYFPIMLWFEKDFGATIKDDLRAALAKELIFEMFKVDENTINYTDMCMAWCKGDKADDGLAMALELYKDSGFLLPPEICYRDDEMGDIHPRKIVDWWMKTFINDTLTLTEQLYLKRLERMTNREVYASEDNQFDISEDILKGGKGRKFDDVSSSEDDEIVPKKDLTDYLKDDEEVEAKFTLPLWNHCVPFEISLALLCRALYFATSPLHHHRILGVEQRLGMFYREKGVGNFVKAHVLGRSDLFKEYVSKTNIFKKCDILSVAEEIIKAKPPVEAPPAE